MFISWMRSLVRRPSRAARRAARTATSRSRLSFRPRFEDLEGRALPSFLAPVGVPAGASEGAVVVGDFNGDGRQDIAVSNLNNTISVALGNGNGTVQPVVVTATTAGSWAMVAGDFNGDG